MAAAGVRPAELADLLRSCGAISLHAPLTPDTHGLIGAPELALLPAGAFVVNVARGGLVDTEALLEALESGHLGGVAVDVLDVEPPSADSPAPAAARLIVNPHAGFYSERAVDEVNRRSAEAIRAVLEDRTPEDLVNAAQC